MSVLVSVDPGLRGSGVAVWRDRVLVAAAYVRSPEKKVRGPQAWCAMADSVAFYVKPFTVDTLVIEVPQVYRATVFNGVNPANLIEVAGVDGAIAQAVQAVNRYPYLPREWKRQDDKADTQHKIEAELSDGEKAAIEPCAESLIHNVYDGIGIGLWHLRRG